MKALVITLGCRLNAADSALLTARLHQAGYTVLDPDMPGEAVPDLVIVNSCAVTAEAVRKSRQLFAQFSLYLVRVIQHVFQLSVFLQQFHRRLVADTGNSGNIVS